MIWLLCVLSSFLAHSYKSFKKDTTSSQFVWAISIAFRLTAKTLAVFNVVLLILAAIFQFSNLNNNCWCSSSKLSRHSKAYIVIIYTGDVFHSMKIAWAWGLLMSFLTAALFLFAINLLRKRSTDESLSSPDCLELTELSERSRRRSAATMTEVIDENRVQLMPNLHENKA